LVRQLRLGGLDRDRHVVVPLPVEETGMTSVIGILFGIAFLVVSLGARHSDAPEFIAWASSWLGSVLVIVGTGKLFFVDD
jgi:hypothetical protein